MHILITGGFDPLHSGHIQAFQQASLFGKLIVGVNSDEWLARKKKSFLLPRHERAEIIRNLSMVYQVYSEWDDSDGTSCAAIDKLCRDHKGPKIFANGGDRVPTNSSTAEIARCIESGVHILYNVGGLKSASSSKFLADYVKRINKNS